MPSAGSLAGDLGGSLGGSAASAEGGVATPTTILGSLLVEFWDSELGIALTAGAVNTWTGQKLGKVITAPGASSRPTYAVDGTNFKGRKVVGLVGGAVPLELNATSGLALTAAGTRPSYLIVRRASVGQTLANSYPLVLDDGAGNGQLLNIHDGLAGDTERGLFTGASEAITTTRDLLVHTIELSSNAGTGSLFRDGVSVGTPTAPAVEQAGDALYLGHQFEGLTTGTVLLAGVYILSAQMSATQRARMRTYFQAHWGSP